MAFRVRLEGADSLRKKLARFPEVSRTEVGKAVATSLVEVHGDAQRTILRGSRSGRVYKKPKSTRTHQASAPGEPPKTDSGRLVSSISIEVDLEEIFDTFFP